MAMGQSKQSPSRLLRLKISAKRHWEAFTSLQVKKVRRHFSHSSFDIRHENTALNDLEKVKINYQQKRL